jgi:hypothetical protein
MPKVEVSRIYRYKLIPESDMAFGGPIDGDSGPCHPGVLRPLGEEGWELVAVTPARLYIFMKRER